MYTERRDNPSTGGQAPPLILPKDDAFYGTNLLLQAAEMMKASQSKEELIGHINQQSLQTGLHVDVAPECFDYPVSGIDLLIQASEVVESEPSQFPAKQETGISLLLQAAEMLDSSPVNSRFSRSLLPHLPPSSASVTDASSSTSVDLSGDPIDVAVTWLEKQLADIERDTNSRWLTDHTYVRPRPFHPKDLTKTECLPLRSYDGRPIAVVRPFLRSPIESSK